MSGLRQIEWMTRAALRAEPDALFVFGDNLRRTGFGGQAKECRGEPNAVGIPTKRLPSMEERAFFADSDLPSVAPVIEREFARLRTHLEAGGTVYWPSAGIGTQRAQLAERAPKIAALIESNRVALMGIVPRTRAEPAQQTFSF